MSTPELTVVCVAGSHPDRLAGLLAALEAQTARDRLEILVARPVAHAAAGSRPVASGAAAQRLIEAGSTLGEVRAAAARAAAAPIVAYVFDHCHPRPGWARAVLDAFAPRVSAVGYVFEPTRDASYAARAAMLSDYARWTAAAPIDGSHALAGQDVAYRRDDLLALGPDLGGRLDFDAFVFDALRRSGCELAVAADAVVRHACLRRPADNMRASYAYSRLVAARMAADEGLGRPRRAARALLLALAAAPLNLLRLARVVIRSPRRVPGLLVLFPAIAAFHVAGAAGLMCGCLAGEGAAATDVMRTELDLDRGPAA